MANGPLVNFYKDFPPDVVEAGQKFAESRVELCCAAKMLAGHAYEPYHKEHDRRLKYYTEILTEYYGKKQAEHIISSMWYSTAYVTMKDEFTLPKERKKSHDNDTRAPSGERPRGKRSRLKRARP